MLIECMFDIVSMRLCASSITTTCPFSEISRASLADFCNSNGYGNVIIYELSACHRLFNLRLTHLAGLDSCSGRVIGANTKPFTQCP